MVGDSADPILASAAAFGAGAFDRRAALEAMVRGATQPCRSANGEYLAAPGPRRATWRSATSPSTSTPTPATPTRSTATPTRSGARRRPRSSTRSTTSRSPSSPPARCATAPPTRAFMRRSANWRRLYNPASGMIEPRYADGAFPPPYDNLGGGGFVEGNSAQYTWMVPQDPAGLIARMGGPARAAARLDRFLRELNGGPGRDPHRPRPARQRADPADALALRLDAAALPHPGRGPPRPAHPLRHLARRLPRQRRPRHALGLVRVRRARPLPRGARGGGAGDRQPALRAGRDPPAAPAPGADPRQRPRGHDARRRQEAPSPGPLAQPGGRSLHPVPAPQRSPLRQALDHLLRARPRRHPLLPARPAPEPPLGRRRRRGAAVLRAPSARCRRATARREPARRPCSGPSPG